MGRADMQTAESLLAMAARLAPGDHDTKQVLPPPPPPPPLVLSGHAASLTPS